MLVMWCLPTALAAEVVWLEPSDPETRALVAQQAQATRSGLDLGDLRVAATDAGPTDDDALRDLSATLDDVRTYETQLDGELVIMRDLEQAVGAVTLLRDDSSRRVLYAALAYQGFAVSRYFEATLGDASEGEPWRFMGPSGPVERPWVDAIGLEPERDITSYEIAEAPQRVTYSRRVNELSDLLPAAITVAGLPAGGLLMVDGRVTEPGPAGNVKVRPGRHLIHAELDGRVVDRWVVRVVPGGAQTVTVELTDAVWTGFVDALAPGIDVPPAVGAAVAAMGGEVWIATPGDPVTVLSVTPQRVDAVEIARPKAAGPREDTTALSAAVVATGGWLTSGDFYTQDPTVPRTVATVNSGQIGLTIAADLDVEIVRIGVGVDLLLPVAEHAVALTGSERLRLRPIPYAAAGLPWVQVAAGFLFPYHPAIGGRATLPVVGPLEIHAHGWYGLATSRARNDGSVWEGLPIGTVNVGIGARL